MSTETPSVDFVDRMLGEIQVYHLELARMVEEYAEVLERAQYRTSDENITFLRGLPGAKYRVMSEYIRQQWIVLESELKKMFPRENEFVPASKRDEATG